MNALAAVLCVAVAALLAAGRPMATERRLRNFPARKDGLDGARNEYECGEADAGEWAPRHRYADGGRTPRGGHTGRVGRAHRDGQTGQTGGGTPPVRVVAGLAGMACAVLLGGSGGVILGIAVAVACDRLPGRFATQAERARTARLAADLPVAVDLLAACLRAGGSWPRSVTAVADAVGGPLGAELEGVAAQVRLGADPAQAWLSLAGCPVLAPLARTAARACHSGAAVAPTLTRLADDRRRAARAEGAARARSAGVWAVAPLGLCFLPAFVLLGVVPAIAGIAGTLLPLR